MTQPLSTLIPSFETELRASRKSPATITSYTRAVRQFAAYAESRSDSEPLARRLANSETSPNLATTDDLTRDRIRDWLADLAANKSPATVLIRFVGLHVFTQWAAAEGEIPEDPMATLRRPQQPEPPPVPVLTDDELNALVKAAKGRPSEYLRRRDEAMIRVFYDSGVRLAELRSMELDDVDMTTAVILVTGKGSKPRFVPFGLKTARALDRHIRSRRLHPQAPFSDALWLGTRGQLSLSGLHVILNTLAEAAGVKDMHAHRLRHTFSHQFLADGGGERELMRLNGWTSSRMLDRYGASLADERARASHRLRSPGDRLK